MLRRIRGLLGVGAIGAVLGGAVGAVLTAVTELMAWGSVSAFNLMVGTLGGVFFGLSVTTGFGLLLAVTSRGRALEELNLRRATAMSALVGASFPVIVVSVLNGSVQPLASMVPGMVIFGGFGALLCGGVVTVAKTARLRELEGESASPRLVEPGDD